MSASHAPTFSPPTPAPRNRGLHSLYEMQPGVLFRIAGHSSYAGVALSVLSHRGMATADNTRIWVVQLGAATAGARFIPGDMFPLPRDTSVVRLHIASGMSLVREQ